MAVDAPLHGALSNDIAYVVAYTVASAVQDDLVNLSFLAMAAVPGARPTVGEAWQSLFTTLFTPFSAPNPPLPPTADDIAAATAGATEQERYTVLDILGEASMFLSASSLQLARRIEALPEAQQPPGWQDTLRATLASARSLGLLARPQGLNAQVLSTILAGLLPLHP